MPRSLNRVELIGFVGDIPTWAVNQGQGVSAFWIVNYDNWKDEEGNIQTAVEWQRVVAWGALARDCTQFLDRGYLAYVEGYLVNRLWKEDEITYHTSEVIAIRMLVLDATVPQDEVFVLHNPRSAEYYKLPTSPHPLLGKNN